MYYFVGGYARTGTTLIANMLHGDPECNPPLSEVTYVEYMMFPYEAMMRGWDSNYWRLFTDLDEFQTFHAGLLEHFFDHLQNLHNCKKLVMKRPFLTRWFPILARMFPESQYVVCVRDPRDVIGSLKSVQLRHKKQDLQQQEKNPFLDLSLSEMAVGYVTGVKDCIGMAKEFPGRFHFVKYEEVVTHPEKSMKSIGEELGLDLALTDFNWFEQNWKLENPFQSKGWGKPITTANIGKHKHQLNHEDLEMVELVCSDLMEVFGYE